MTETQQLNKTKGFIDHPNHYDFQPQKLNSFKQENVKPQNFYAWTKENMYRTTYISHYTEKPSQPKNGVIPKYGGYVPYIQAQNMFGKSFSSLARDAFNQQNLAKNQHQLSSTGFNVKKEHLIDQSKKASSSKYGKSSIQTSHPAWVHKQWVSTAHDTYINPKDRLNPTFRQTDVHLQTQKAMTKTGGFSVNHAYMDGTGWNPHPVLNGDRNRTQYRDRLNAKVDFHRNTIIQKSRTLPKPESNYKYNY